MALAGRGSREAPSADIQTDNQIVGLRGDPLGCLPRRGPLRRSPGQLSLQCRVDVTVDGASHASYVFAPDCAWDNVPWSDSFQRLAADSTAEVQRFLGRSVA